MQSNRSEESNDIEPQVSELGDASVPVNFKALGAALYELSELNSFIADMCRVLQQEDLMDNEKVVTQCFPHHAAAAIENACRKELELHEVIQAAIGKEFKPYEYRPNISLFEMPSDSTFYYGGFGHKGVFDDTQQPTKTEVN